ncbi:MAG: hypothetical protein RJA49_2519, partial [Actinomycetota bacterium]
MDDTPLPVVPEPSRRSAATTERYPGLAVGALASIGAGAIHAAATGIHAEHPELARLFVVVTVLQLGVGVWALVRPTRFAAGAVAIVNTAAVIAWLATRLTGITWIDGLGTREAAQFADTVCAGLGALAAGAAVAALLVGKRPAAPTRLAVPALLVAALAIPAMWSGGTHVHTHSHDDGGTVAAGADGHTHSDGATDPATGDTVHTHDTTVDPATGDTVHTHDTVPGAVTTDWPRPYDPAQPMDLSGVPGVTPEEQARAEKLIADTQRILPKWATTAAAEADGYTSIGDAGTGSEHFIKISLIPDDDMLDPNAPESLVYTVKGSQKTLAGAMFIASARPTDDPSLTNWAGPLMTWHNHGNLC